MQCIKNVFASCAITLVQQDLKMDNRKYACMAAAAFLGVALTAGATSSLAGPRDIVVKGERVDPKLQRKVFYHDLNIAE